MVATRWNSNFKIKKRSAIKRIKPQKPLKRSSKPRKTKTSVWAEYGLERPAYVRYSGKKGVFWWLLSRKVRQRDFKRWGSCINCGKRLNSWQEGQCGHYLSAEKCGFLLLFDETNLALECKGCNKYDKQKLGYEQNLDKRYGEGTAFGLKKRYWESKKGTPAKEWSQLEYDRKIRALQKELEIYD